MENLDSHGNELQIRNVEYNDSGSYVCMAENVLGKVQKEVTLFVEGEIQPLTRQIHFKSLRCKVTDFRRLPVYTALNRAFPIFQPFGKLFETVITDFFFGHSNLLLF